MLRLNRIHWNTIERWSSTLFLVGGILMTAHAVMMVIQAFTGLATPPDVFAPTGSLLVFAGLFGMYRTLADRAPTSSHVGAVCVALGVVGFSVITGRNLAELGGVGPPDWVAIFTVPALIGTIPGFLAFGVASLRADAHSRTVGFLLMASAVIFLALIVNVIVLGASALGGIIVGSLLALTHLTLGYSLRTGPSSTDSVTPASDVAAG